MLTSPTNITGPYCTNTEYFIKSGCCKKSLEVLEQFKSLEEIKQTLIHQAMKEPLYFMFKEYHHNASKLLYWSDDMSLETIIGKIIDSCYLAEL